MKVLFIFSGKSKFIVFASKHLKYLIERHMKFICQKLDSIKLMKIQELTDVVVALINVHSVDSNTSLTNLVVSLQ